MRLPLAAAVTALAAGCSGFEIPARPVPTGSISPADTAKLATLYCECVPYRCEHNPRYPANQLLAAVQAGRGLSMATVRDLGSPAECNTSIVSSWGEPVPGAMSRLRAFYATVRPVQGGE